MHERLPSWWACRDSDPEGAETPRRIPNAVCLPISPQAQLARMLEAPPGIEPGIRRCDGRVLPFDHGALEWGQDRFNRPVPAHRLPKLWYAAAQQRYTNTDYRRIRPDRLDYIIIDGQRYYADPPAPDWQEAQAEYEAALDSLDTAPRK